MEPGIPLALFLAGALNLIGALISSQRVVRIAGAGLVLFGLSVMLGFRPPLPIVPGWMLATTLLAGLGMLVASIVIRSRRAVLVDREP